MTDLDDMIAKERHRRIRMQKQQRAMRWWRERGDLEPPAVEHWCDHCACFYGVVHTMHVDPVTSLPRQCPNLATAMHGNRQCACIECVCAERLFGKGSLHSRITQS